MPRKEGGRGLIFEDCVELAIGGLELYVHGIEGRLIQAARGDRINGLEAAIFEQIEKRENNRRLAEGSSTWSVFEAD